MVEVNKENLNRRGRSDVEEFEVEMGEGGWRVEVDVEALGNAGKAVVDETSMDELRRVIPHIKQVLVYVQLFRE